MLTVDRIEGNYLILVNEIEEVFEVNKRIIPNAKENDVIRIDINKEAEFKVIDINESITIKDANNTTYTLPINLIDNIKLNDFITFKILGAETKRRKDYITSLMNSLFE